MYTGKRGSPTHSEGHTLDLVPHCGLRNICVCHCGDFLSNEDVSFIQRAEQVQSQRVQHGTVYQLHRKMSNVSPHRCFVVQWKLTGSLQERYCNNLLGNSNCQGRTEDNKGFMCVCKGGGGVGGVGLCTEDQVFRHRFSPQLFY